MRKLMSALFVLAGLAVLPACGDAGGGRNEIRESLVNSCLAESGVRPAPAGFDWDRFCGCVTDGVMAGKSNSDLKAGPPTVQERRTVVNRCMTQMGFGRPPARR